jgi:oleate hydratase
MASMFRPRSQTDRPLPVPECSKNLAFVSQFVEITEDVVFSVELSVRVAQMAVYQLLDIDLEIPPIKHHDNTIKIKFDAGIRAVA